MTETRRALPLRDTERPGGSAAESLPVWDLSDLYAGKDDPRLAAEMDDLAVAKMAAGRRVTLAEVDGRPLMVKLGHALARLWSPYL